MAGGRRDFAALVHHTRCVAVFGRRRARRAHRGAEWHTDQRARAVSFVDDDGLTRRRSEQTSALDETNMVVERIAGGGGKRDVDGDRLGRNLLAKWSSGGAMAISRLRGTGRQKGKGDGWIRPPGPAAVTV